MPATKSKRATVYFDSALHKALCEGHLHRPPPDVPPDEIERGRRQDGVEERLRVGSPAGGAHEHPPRIVGDPSDTTGIPASYRTAAPVATSTAH